jgi:hypothetical protein
MAGTIIIELALAAWVLTRYAITTNRRLIVTMLILLSAFQFAEFNVCGSSPPDLIWSRLGYVFITLLPPLGVHLVNRLRHERRAWLVRAGYAAGAVFAAAFAFLPTSLNQGVCTGNYVIFRLTQPLAALYCIYYFALLAITLALALKALPHATPKQRTVLRDLSFGYTVFIAPVIIIIFILPATRLGIPSIMCGFAVLLAIILGLRVAPNSEA